MMTKTIVVLYDDIAVARQVVEDLVNADFERTSISLITNDANNQYSRYLETDYVPREDAVTATEGAGFGAIVGVLTGALVGVAALTIPGVGLVIAAGPIMAGLTGALAGTITGGIVGALVKSGVPEDEAPYYAEGIRRGGTLVSVETSNTLRAEDIMNRYGSINIHERIDVWRQSGWKGFKSTENEDSDKSSREPLTTVTTDTTTTRVTHMPHNGAPVSAKPVHTILDEEPSIDEGDTDKFPSLMVTAPTDLTISDDPVLDLEDGKHVTTAKPNSLTLEEELDKEHEHTLDDFQAIDLNPHHPKG